MYVHYAYTPIGVKGDGKGSIILSDGTKEMIIDNIDTVIYCTGYLTNIEMLNPSLRPSMLRLYFSEYEIPMDWEMANNSLSKEFGDIPIGTILDPPFVRRGKCFIISLESSNTRSYPNRSSYQNLSPLFS